MLVRNYERSDFEFLMSNPLWRGRQLRVPVQHAHLARYNRQLVNWTVPERVYREFVLSPQIDPRADGAMDWRRPLWENFYPRIRREAATETAAEIVVRFLRERVYHCRQR